MDFQNTAHREPGQHRRVVRHIGGFLQWNPQAIASRAALEWIFAMEVREVARSRVHQALRRYRRNDKVIGDQRGKAF